MNKIYIPAILVLVLVLVFHILGMNMHWYMQFSWYDIVMHITTGAGIALSALWFLETIRKDNLKSNLMWMVVLTLAAGIIWEVFEVIYNIAGFHYGTLRYWVDSVKDLADDTLGSLIVYIFFKKYF